MTVIYHEHEGLTNAGLTEVLPKLKALKFKGVYGHMEVTIPTGVVEGSVTELRARDLQLLQRDNIYIFCDIKNKELLQTPTKSQILTSLNKSYRNPIGKFRVMLKNTEAEEEQFDDIAMPIRKDLTFMSLVGEVGWYNKETNILWVGDLTHFNERSLPTLNLLAKNVKEIQDKGSIRNAIEITIGTDPEFEIVDEVTGALIPACNILAGGLTSEVGTDGHNRTGEIRPRYTTNPLELARNIRRLMHQLAASGLPTNSVVSAGGGTKVNTGGHIHLGGVYAVTEGQRKIIFKLVAEPLINCQGRVRSEGHPELCTENGYDTLRPQDWGLEFRSLPSFIVNRETTEAVLCTFYVVARAAIGGEVVPSDFGIDPLKPDNQIGVPKMGWYKMMPYYQFYQPHIDRFYQQFIREPKDLQGRDALGEWGYRKIQKTNLVITTPLDWVRKHLPPVQVSFLNGRRVVSIRGSGNQVLTYGFNRNAQVLIKSFAKKYFLIDEQYQEKDEGADYVVYFPDTWTHLREPVTFLQEFAPILQKAIILTEKGA